MRKETVVGLSAIAQILEMDIDSVKVSVSRGQIPVWREKYRIHAYVEDLKRYKKRYPGTPWCIQQKENRLIVYKGRVKGVWDTDTGELEYRRSGLVTKRENMAQHSFLHFFNELKTMNP